MEQRPIYNHTAAGGAGMPDTFRTNQRVEDEIDLMEIVGVLVRHIWLLN